MSWTLDRRFPVGVLAPLRLADIGWRHTRLLDEKHKSHYYVKDKVNLSESRKKGLIIVRVTERTLMGSGELNRVLSDLHRVRTKGPLSGLER